MPNTYKLDDLLSVTISSHRDRPNLWTGVGAIYRSVDPSHDLESVAAEGRDRQQAEDRALAKARAKSTSIRRRSR